MVDDSEYDLENTDRPRGILTPADRQFLLGVGDVKPKSQVERNKRARIRERLYHAILDFWVLYELEERDRRAVFTAKGDNDMGRLTSLQQGLISALAFLYRDVSDAGQLNFEELLRTAILRVRFTASDQRMIHPGSVNIDIEEPQTVDYGAVAEVVERDGIKGLTESQLQHLADFLLEQEGWTADELSDLLRAAADQ